MDARQTAWGPWLALKMVRGVGNVGYRELLQAFGEPGAVFQARPADLEAAGARSETARSIAGFDRWDLVEAQLRRLNRARARLVTWLDAAYPPGLKELHDPPPFLFVAGDVQPDDQIAVAVVGSRSPSAYGRQMTRALCDAMARLGLVVVSGLARGIDAEAHQAALRAGGRTIAVLGSGIDVIYPPEHHALFHQVVEHGSVMSEFFMGTTPEAENFPARNRIISGLTLGTVVVEAAERSGSLITAQCAADQGREVFAVPGPVGPRSSGPHRLIKNGAKLTERVEDIVEEIAPHLLRAARPAAPAPERLGEMEARVLDVLGPEPRHVDQIIAGTGLPPASALELLLALELKGWARQMPGKYFVAVEDAVARIGD